MNENQLNARFGTPGRIVFKRGLAGYPEVIIANKYGAAKIALLGANVLSYRPTGHSEVIFTPRKQDHNRADSFHGGIPLCWPMFGNRLTKDLPQHGFARKMVFGVRGVEYSEEMTEITLFLSSDDETLKLWPHEFDLEVKISVSMKLNLKVTTLNTGDKPFTFSCGFHPYFLLRERNDSVVRGLGGMEFFDGMKGVEGKPIEGDLKIDFSPDNIYNLPDVAKHEFVVVDSGLKRAIAIVSSGNDRAVVWNPGAENKLPDLEDDDWRRFICVEPVSDWPGGRTLKPDESYSLTAAIQATI